MSIYVQIWGERIRDFRPPIFHFSNIFSFKKNITKIQVYLNVLDVKKAIFDAILNTCITCPKLFMLSSIFDRQKQKWCKYCLNQGIHT